MCNCEQRRCRAQYSQRTSEGHTNSKPVCLGCLRLVLHVCGTYVRLALPARKCAVSMATGHMSERWRKDEGPS